MDKEDYKRIYTDNGFLWTSHLENFVHGYAGLELEYPHPRARTPVMARFCHVPLIQVGRSYGQHKTTVHFLKEEIAPIGDCSDGNIELLLTESGRLIGFRDFTLYTWSARSAESDWEASLARLLSGREPEELDVIPVQFVETGNP